MAAKQGDNSGDINKVESGDKSVSDASDKFREISNREQPKLSYDDSKREAERLNGPMNTWLPSKGEAYEAATAAKVADFKSASPEQQVAKFDNHTKSIESVKNLVAAITEKYNNFKATNDHLSA